MLGDPKEAAIKLGYEPKIALSEGLRLLNSRPVRRRLDAEKPWPKTAAAGLRRLAFGRINDALELLKDDPIVISLGSLDLYNVSEIKRVKGGGVEVKFFNRLEALELLSRIEEQEGESQAAESFFNAIKTAPKEGLSEE